MKPLVAIAAVLLLAGCAGSPNADTTAEPDPAPATTTVEWEDYAPELQGQIDALAVAADCTGLQSAFDTADANSDATRDRTGHGSAKLMAYIDEALKTAGCY